MCMFHYPDAFIKGLNGYDEDCFRDPTGTTIMFQIEMKHVNRVNRVRWGAAIDTRALLTYDDSQKHGDGHW